MKSKPLVGMVLVVGGVILVYMGWKGLHVVTNYVSGITKKIP